VLAAHVQLDNMSIESVINFYDKNADIIKNNYQPYNAVILHPNVEQHFIRLFSFAGLKKNSKILDIGCGNGFLLNQVCIQFKGCELHGLDISSKQLSYAKNIKTYHGDIETIDINEKFDYIFCMEVIGYATNQIEVINKILSMLNTNGTLICSSFICEEIDTWQRDIIKYKIDQQNKEDGCCYGQISINELNKIDIRTYDNIKIINSNYFNFAEKRGLFWKKEEVLKKHILFKVKI